MNNQSNSAYFLLDAGSRVVLAREVPFETASFAVRAVLDLHLSCVPRKVFRGYTDSVGGSWPRSEYRNGRFARIDGVVDEDTEKKTKEVDLVVKAYNFLLWHANYATEGIWSTSTVDQSDLHIALSDSRLYAEAYAEAKSIPLHDAVKQVEFDIQALKTVAIRRKKILWQFGTEILAVRSEAELDAFRARVRNDVVTVGAV